jgi:parvulin-like peptidyl-prolyl isomerase
VRRQVTWELTWQKYRSRYVTAERLESFFEKHHREFDGTEVSVSHILLKVRTGDDGADATEPLASARDIHRMISSGELSFEEAAKRHSTGPSGRDGGHVGFIRRRGAMVEAFAQAAFALEVGDVSEPVITRFGVHLIRVNEIKPGTKELSQVRSLVEEALERELLGRLARHEEQHTPVHFTGKAPYFKPGTRELVLAGNAEAK